MYAVTAATGQLGRLVVEALTDHVPRSSIVAVVRDAAKASDLGVTVRQADYGDADALAAALQGVRRVRLIAATDMNERVRHHGNVVEAARRAGVAFLAYTSVLHADRWPVAAFRSHAETEAIVRASGLSFAILRNGWYGENNTIGLAQALAHGAILGAAGSGRIAWAARRDYAEAAATVLLGGDIHHGQIYELAGDRALTLADLAAEVSRQTGRTVTYADLPEDAYAQVMLQAGLPEPLARVLAEVDARAIAMGLLDDESRALSGLIGRPTTPMSETVRAALA